MRGVPIVILVLAAIVPCVAQDADRSVRPRVDAVVPVPPTEHERLHYFGKRHHHLVPGTVTIDKPGYVCDLDHLSFKSADAFVAHLRSVHHAPPESIPDRLLVLDGQVHFLSE